MTVEERVLAAYYERLSAYAVDKSRVIAIEFQSADPELAARAANAIAERYLSMQQVAKQDQARAAGQWLSGEIEKLRGKVSEAEAKVEEFRAKSNLFIGANNTSLAGQQLTEFNTQLSAARAQKADAETRARLIREQLRSGQSLESSDVTNSELIRRLSEQRVTLRAQLAEQSSTLLAQHPRIKELRAQIADLDQQIRTEGERLVRSLENDAKVAGARVVDAERQPRPAQAAGGLDQRPGRAAARARARSQGAARPVRILSGEVPRGERPRQHRCGAGGCAHHLARGGVEHAVLSEEGSDRPDRHARHALPLRRLRRDRRAAGRRALSIADRHHAGRGRDGGRSGASAGTRCARPTPGRGCRPASAGCDIADARPRRARGNSGCNSFCGSARNRRPSRSMTWPPCCGRPGRAAAGSP